MGRSLHEAGFASFVRAGGKVLVLDPAADIPGCASGFSAGEAGERLQTAIAVARKSHLIIDAMTGIGIQGSLRGIPPHSPPPLVSTARLPMSPPCQTVSRQAIFRWYLPWIRHPASV